MARVPTSPRQRSRSPGTVRRRLLPTFENETGAIGRGLYPVVGIDEAGRGPWAGPVVAAAVILDPANLPAGIDDSKALDAAARERALDAIRASGADVGIGIADVERIDATNILQATFWAMAQAVAGLSASPRIAFVDGNMLPQLPCEARAVVGGDAVCLSIAAASIVAKVTRDRLMSELAAEYPDYGFERHKGYGTPEHKAALEHFGPSPHHRRSFRPVQRSIKRNGIPAVEPRRP